MLVCLPVARCIAPTCFLTDTQVNETAVTQPLMVRNTSLLPATITQVAVNNQSGQSSLYLLSTTCTLGLVLSPNESCDVRVLYRARSAAALNQGSVAVGLSSTNDPNNRFILMNLVATTVLAVSDGVTLFRSGFEFGAAQCLE